MIPGWLHSDEEKLLRNTARASKHNTVLEIGCLYGKSSLSILEGMRDKWGDNFRLVCIDPWLYRDSEREFPPVIFYRELNKRGFDNKVVQIKDLSSRAAGYILQQFYDFCFIDGDHATVPALYDLLTCAMKTEKILLHDLHSSTHKEVNAAADVFLKYTGWKETGKAASIGVLEGKYIMPAPEYRDTRIPG
jgi:predicted O-methyltransferase YrrM